MKPTLLTILLTLSLAQCLLASGPPIIRIFSADKGVSYRLENTNARTEKDAKTPGEVEEWARDVLKQSQEELIMIYPDAGTTFKTVSDLLRILKSAGAPQYAVVTVESIDGVRTAHSIFGKSDKILSHRESGVSTPRRDP